MSAIEKIEAEIVRVTNLSRVNTKGYQYGFVDGLNWVLSKLRDDSAPSPWVKCSERLPKDDEWVLMTNKDRDRICAGFGWQFPKALIVSWTHWLPITALAPVPKEGA